MKSNNRLNALVNVLALSVMTAPRYAYVEPEHCWGRPSGNSGKNKKQLRQARKAQRAAKRRGR